MSIITLFSFLLMTGCDEPRSLSALQARFGASFPGDPACSLPQRDLEPDSTPAEEAQALADNTAFAFDAYRMATGDGTNGINNVFISPHSISVAFAMALPQANDTAPIIRNLHFSLDPSRLHPAMNALMLGLDRHAQVEPSEGVEPFLLNSVNAAWVEERLSVTQPTCDLYGAQYGAPLARLAFAREPELCEELINAWVSDRTFGHIPELMRGNVTALTRWVLVNAIYFRASWSQPFSEAATAPGPFTRLSGDTVQADLMANHSGLYVRYAADEAWEAVALSYESDGLEMIVVMPAQGRFEEVESAMDPSFLAALSDGMTSEFVELILPRFTVRTRLDLSPLLEDPYSSAIHEGYVNVHEKGTEAAAATAVIIGDNSAPVADRVVTIDRPFIFFVRDRVTGLVLFIGRVLDPTI